MTEDEQLNACDAAWALKGDRRSWYAWVPHGDLGYAGMPIVAGTYACHAYLGVDFAGIPLLVPLGPLCGALQPHHQFTVPVDALHASRPFHAPSAPDVVLERCRPCRAVHP